MNPPVNATARWPDERLSGSCRKIRRVGFPANSPRAVPRPPAKPARTRLSPADRHAQLLRCAINALAEHGVVRATHAHVASRAGVSVAAVHAYFRTREDLVVATLSALEAPLLRITAEVAAMKLSARESLARMVAGFDHAARTDPDSIKVWLDWSTGFRADVWPRYLEMQERILADVRTALARGKRSGELSTALNVRAAARLFVGGGRTVAFARFAGASEDEITTLIDQLVRSIVSIGRDQEA